ncbi:hypothetical protein GCM10007036_26360 [Alsobacter metallidurans]|uniref:Blue-light-activated histidine kinase n=1 Tax=Alsobacter metallidurans TaxID=340221 RepID=A0A917I916_9HYPH|nr:PAS domain S-box protein [Alsobacter metallidurans]GGH21806.1 hypothetical protein GCM10007036_26360 [Alsobacter metallidurans]
MEADLVERLSASEERLRLALEATGLGTWDYDIEQDRNVWSSEFRAIIGIEADGPANRTVFAGVIHPDDHAWVMQRYQDTYAPDGPDRYDAEFRIVRPSGAERWVVARGRIIRDAAGRAVRGIGTLHDVTDRKRSELALRASEGRLRATHENAAVGIAELGADGRIKSVNEALCRITGYAREEMLGAQNFTFVSDRGFAEQDEALFRRQRAGEIESYELEKKISTKGGEERWTHVSSTSVRSGTGEFLYAVRVVQDITDLKTAANQREMLLAELNHRVKNSLAVVMGMITQTIKGSETFADFRSAIEGRIMALKNSYELLSDSSWDGADLGALLEVELKAFGIADQARWRVLGPPAQLGPKQVVPVALIFHELATNAVKHGALATPDGSVNISWTVDREESGARVRLFWRESASSGGAGSDRPRRKGFGSTLIGLCAERELQGVYESAFSPALEASLEFPLRVAAAA